MSKIAKKKKGYKTTQTMRKTTISHNGKSPQHFGFKLTSDRIRATKVRKYNRGKLENGNAERRKSEKREGAQGRETELVSW